MSRASEEHLLWTQQLDRQYEKEEDQRQWQDELTEHETNLEEVE